MLKVPFISSKLHVGLFLSKLVMIVAIRPLFQSILVELSPNLFEKVNRLNQQLLFSFLIIISTSISVLLCFAVKCDHKICVWCLLNNYFMRQRVYVEILSKREVWRARKRRKGCSRRSRGQL